MELIHHTNEALTPHLLEEEYPQGWRKLKIPIYDEKAEPQDHLHNFVTRMEDVTTREDTRRCHCMVPRNLRVVYTISMD